jgi:hypothetical protein
MVAVFFLFFRGRLMATGGAPSRGRTRVEQVVEPVARRRPLQAQIHKARYRATLRAPREEEASYTKRVPHYVTCST